MGGIPGSAGNVPDVQTQRLSVCGFLARGLAAGGDVM